MKKTVLFSLATISLIGQPNFVLIGPPGCGKGTFSFFMINEKDYHQICLGDIIRFHKKNNTETGKAIAANNGFVDDEMAYKIIRDEIHQCVENKRSFIIDGFPRNIPAFEFLIKVFSEKDINSSIVFVHFKIDDQTCIDRICNRIVCFKCTEVFNTTTKKPKKEMICDSCNAPLETREGEGIDATKKRLAYYREHTEPLVSQVNNSFKVITIDAKSPMGDCLAFYKTI